MYLNSNAIERSCANCIFCQAVITVIPKIFKCGSYIALLKKDVRIVACLAQDNAADAGYFATVNRPGSIVVAYQLLAYLVAARILEC